MSTDPETTNGASPQAGPMPSMALYERLIDDGIARADQQGGAIDHITARRVAIWIAARPQPRDFAQALAQFTRTGAFPRQLIAELRARAGAPNSPYQSDAARLLQYCSSRGPDRGPIGADFGAACDQIDQADAALADRRERVKRGIKPPEQASSAVTTRADRDYKNHTITFTMDETTAGIAISAIVARAAEREAYARDVWQLGQGLPEGSYGRRNREAIAGRETQAAARLRAIERAYLIAMEHVATADPGPAATRGDPDQAADREMEAE